MNEESWKMRKNIARIREIFPGCVTEAQGKDGKLKLYVDFDQLRQELSESIVEGPQERYHLNWPGKQNSLLAVNAPISKTLCPCREESVNFDTTKNLFIEGDNLDALKLLQETYLGKIKMIYIDPPYNTGKNILYMNNYSRSNGRFHSNWLTMMYPRLKLARNLLKKEGLICISIDHNELNTLTSIADEIFGNENRLGLITAVHKPEGRNQAKFFGPSNEFMLFYAKDIHCCTLRNVVIDNKLLKSFDQSDHKGLYKLKNFIRLSDGKYSLRINKPLFYYPIYINTNTHELEIYSKPGYETIVYPITESGQERTWKTTKETFIERYKNGDILPKNKNGKWIIYEKLRERQVLKTHWLDKKYHGFHFGTKLVSDLLGSKAFDFPKSLYLVSDALKIITQDDDIILDFFAGSATTAHAVMLLNAQDGGNRKFIMVQLPESCNEKSEAFKAGYKTIAEISKERIRRAGKKILEGKCHEGWNKDIGFGVLKIAEKKE
jgi:adenine-specific DNA-methyltransferase